MSDPNVTIHKQVYEPETEAVGTLRRALGCDFMVVIGYRHDGGQYLMETSTGPNGPTSKEDQAKWTTGLLVAAQSVLGGTSADSFKETKADA